MPLPVKFPEPSRHEHPPIQDVSAVLAERLTLGQRSADRLAAFMGSWPFLLGQTILLALWVFVNALAWASHWDPYPFILLNLFLSLQAAYAAPVIMMSQNRQILKDRIEAHNDFQVNQKTEEEVRLILDHLDAQNLALESLSQKLESLQAELARRAAPPGS
jgi:uncharacterized membrane protein